MKIRNIFLAWMMAILVAGSAAGQDPVTLKWNFARGKKFYQKLVTETKQVMTVMNLKYRQNQRLTYYFRWTPRRRHPRGGWIIVQRIEAVRFDLNVGGNRITYDSTGNNPPSTMNKFFDSLVGSEFEIKLNQNHRVTEVDGQKQLVNKLGQANPSMKPILKQLFSEDGVKQMSEPMFSCIPTRPIKVGSRWNLDSELDLGPIGGYTVLWRYVYEGKQNSLHRIKMEGKVAYAPPKQNGGGGLPFVIKAGKLASKKCEGVVLFDNQIGFLHSQETTVELSGNLDINVGGMDTKVTLEQTQTVSNHVTLSNPLTRGK